MNASNGSRLATAVLILWALLASAQSLHAAPGILGYYSNWSTYSGYQPPNIPTSVNEVLYAFAEVGDCNPSSPATETNPSACLPQNSQSGAVIHTGVQNYQLYSTDPWSDFYVYKNSAGVNIGGLGNIAQTLATGRKLELSIGGWTLSAAIRVAIQPQYVTNFIGSIIAFMKQAQQDASAKGIGQIFDGVDVDWEPNGNQWTVNTGDPSVVPVTATDLANYLNFLKQLKAALTAAGYNKLTIAMTSNPSVIANVNSVSPGYWSALANAGVQLNLMTYDYNGQGFAGSCTTTAFNAPLYSDPNNPCAAVKAFDANDSVLALKTAGVPAANIGIGVPAYGRAYAIGSTGSLNPTNPYVPFVSPRQNVFNVAIPTYYDVWTNREIYTGRVYGGNSAPENTRWSTIADYFSVGQSFASAYVNWRSPAFISYSSYADAQNAMTYAVSNGLASVMVWALDQDIQPGDTDNDNKPINWNTTSVVAGLASKQP